MNKTFTLTELFVVIVAVAVPAVAIASSLSLARELARRAQCAANLHRWNLAYEHHAMDKGGDYPGLVNWSNMNAFMSGLNAHLEDGFKDSGWVRDKVEGLSDYIEEGYTECPSRVPPRSLYDPLKGGPGWPLPADAAGQAAYHWYTTDYWLWSGYGSNSGHVVVEGREDETCPWQQCEMSGYITYADSGPSMTRCGGTEALDWWQPETGRFPVVNDHWPRVRPTNVMVMDVGWAEGGCVDAYYECQADDLEELNRPISNHRIPGPEGIASNGVVVMAEGANAMLFDGSVHWADLMGEVYLYGKDYYHAAYVDEFLSILPLESSISSWTQ